MKPSQEELGTFLDVSGKAQDKNTRLGPAERAQTPSVTVLETWLGGNAAQDSLISVTPAPTAAQKLCWVAQRV